VNRPDLPALTRPVCEFTGWTIVPQYLGSAERQTMTMPSDRFHVLVADDQAAVLDALKLLLRSEGFEVDIVRSPQVVLESINLREYDAVLLDLNYARDTTSGGEGLGLLQQIREIDSQLPVIVMTAWATIDIAVEAVRRGARNFIQKPWEDEPLVLTLRTHAELCRALRQAQRLECANAVLRSQKHPVFIAESHSMRAVMDTIVQVGPSDANVLITGEHGTGKEVVAQMLHAISKRADNTLVAVNTGGLPEGTFESELFGHVKGAFTDASTDRIGRFEMAEGGTLFLDEIANVPIRQQAKLLRVLETGEMERVGSSKTRRIDVRLMSATNADLSAECAAGRFREDLLFRLNTIEIHLPPLRDRIQDIPLLAAHFLSRYSARYGKCIQGFTPDAMSRLADYRWPGNVRELDHTVERAVIMCRGSLIEAAHMGLNTSSRAGSVNLADMSLEEAEALLISKALARYNGNISQAAEVLGLSRGTFYRRMEKHGFYVSDAARKEKR
jgi:DNA-binding NtrC family response regulator